MKNRRFSKKNDLTMKFSKVLYGVPGGLRGSWGSPGELFGGPEATLKIRGATLEGPGGGYSECRKMVRECFFKIFGGQIHIFPRF